MTGTAYATSAEMAGWMGAFPGYADNRDAMLRVIRNHRRAAHGETAGYEGLAIRPQPLDAAQLPRRPPRRGGKKGLGQGFGAGRAARLPQRPGLGHRPHRHDRPGDGLRHHRHRARLRPGEVQEAGGRRLLQDHQPHRPAGARDAGLRRRRPSSASSPTRSATARSPERPRSTTRRWRRAASTVARSSVWKSRSRPPSTSASPSRATRWATPSAATCWVSTTKRSPIPSSTC